MSIDIEAAGTGSAQPGADSGEGAGSSGVQQRFGELTAIVHSQRDTIAQVQQQLAETQKVAIQAMRELSESRTQKPPGPSALDQHLAKLPEEIREPLGAAIHEAFQQFSTPLRAQQAELEFNSMAQQYGLTDSERDVARRTFQGWVSRGIPATVGDAIKATIGTVNVEQREKLAARANQTVVQTPPSAASGQTQKQGNQLPDGQTAPYPEDFDDWDHNKQHAYLSKRLGYTK